MFCVKSALFRPVFPEFIKLQGQVNEEITSDCSSTNCIVFPSCIMQKFVLGRMVKAANATMLLSGVGALIFSSLIALVGFRSLPFCACYDSRTGLVRAVVSQTEQLQTGLA